MSIPSTNQPTDATDALLDEYEALVRARAECQYDHLQRLENLDRQIGVSRDGLRAALKPEVGRLLPGHSVTELPENVEVRVRRKPGRPPGSKSKTPSGTTLSRASLVAVTLAKLDEGDNRVRASLEPIVTFLANEPLHKATVKDIAETIGLNREACRLRCGRGVKVGILRKFDGSTYGLKKY